MNLSRACGYCFTARCSNLAALLLLLVIVASGVPVDRRSKLVKFSKPRGVQSNRSPRHSDLQQSRGAIDSKASKGPGQPPRPLQGHDGPSNAVKSAAVKNPGAASYRHLPEQKSLRSDSQPFKSHKVQASKGRDSVKRPLGSPIRQNRRQPSQRKTTNKESAWKDVPAVAKKLKARRRKSSSPSTSDHEFQPEVVKVTHSSPDEDKDRGRRVKFVESDVRHTTSHSSRKALKEGALLKSQVDSEDASPETEEEEESESPQPTLPPDTLENIWPLLYQTYLMPPNGLQRQADIAAEKRSHRVVSSKPQDSAAGLFQDLSVMSRLWAAVHDRTMQDILKPKSMPRYSSSVVDWSDSIKKFASGLVYVEIGSGVTALTMASMDPHHTVIAILTESSQVTKLQTQVAKKDVRNLFLCYIPPTEVPLRMKAIHRNSQVMFGTLFLSNLTALVDAHLPHEFEDLIGMLMGLAQRVILAGPYDMSEHMRSFFDNWKSVKDMVERSLVAARITAKIDSVVKDEPTSRLLPRRLEDQDLPREYLERGQGHYVPPMIHLMAYTINITSSYRRLDANSCLEAPLKTKKCKLVHIAVNGSSFVFLQEIATKSSQKRSSKASPAILRINNRITSLPVQDVLALRPMPDTLRYLSEQLNSLTWQQGQDKQTLRLSAEQVSLDATQTKTEGIASTTPAVSNALDVLRIPSPQYTILVSSIATDATLPESLENARYPEVAGPTSVEMEKGLSDGPFVPIKARSEPFDPGNDAGANGPVAPVQDEEDHNGQHYPVGTQVEHGELPGPVPHPRSDEDSEEQGRESRQQAAAPMDRRSMNQDRVGLHQNDNDNVDSQQDQEGDFAGADPALDTPDAARHQPMENDQPGEDEPAHTDDVDQAAGGDVNVGGDSDQQAEHQPDSDRHHDGGNKHDTDVDNYRRSNPADEDVTRDHLDKNGQPETEFRNDDVVLGGQRSPDVESEESDENEGDQGGNANEGGAAVDSNQAPVPENQPDMNPHNEDKVPEEEESKEDDEQNAVSRDNGRHLLSYSSRANDYVAKGVSRHLLWASRESSASKSLARLSSSATSSTQFSATSGKKSKDDKPTTVSKTDSPKTSGPESSKSTSGSSTVTVDAESAKEKLEEYARQIAVDMQTDDDEEDVEAPKLIDEEMQFNAQWAVLKRELQKSSSKRFSVFVYGGLTQVLIACKIAHLWPEASVVLVVQPGQSSAFSRYRKLRSSLKLTNIIGSVKLVTSAVSLDVHKEVDVAHYQVLGAAVFAELIAEPDTFVAYLSRMLTFSRITFLELPSPKQLSVSSDLLTVHRNDELSSYKLQGLIYRALSLAGARNASLNLLPVSLLQNDMWVSGFPLLRVKISQLSRQVVMSCSSDLGELQMLPSGVSLLNKQLLARVGKGFSLSLLLTLGLDDAEKQQLFMKYLRLPLDRDMCPKYLLWRSGDLLFDNFQLPTLRAPTQYPHDSNRALVRLLRANVDKKKSWSFLEYGSGYANATIDLARMHPNCTFISLESSTPVAYKQQKRLDELNITNMVVGRIDSDASLLQKLLESPDMMRYQMVGLEYFLKMIELFTRPHFNTMLGSIFSTSVSSFIQVPSAKMLSLAFLTFYPELPSGELKTSAGGIYVLANHPTSEFENAELRMIGESAKSPAVSTVNSFLLHPLSEDSEQEHGWKLLRVNLANLTTTVNHHFDYAVDGHDRKYTQHCESNSTHFKIYLERQVDGFVIPYDRLEGISLIALLRLGLLSEVKARLYEQFIKMPLYEDMAPWNIVFNGGHLEYIDYDTKDKTFDKMVAAAYQVMSVLMNFQRTVKDFGHCQDGEARTPYNFPYMGSCVGSSFHGKCRNSQYPVPCGDHSCRSTYIECLNALLEMEKKKELKASAAAVSLRSLRQKAGQGNAAGGLQHPELSSSPYDGGHWSFDGNGYVDPAKKPINTGIR